MEFHLEATGIGSVPHIDVREACNFIRSHFIHVPFWPQMPKASFYENMYVQYSSRIPGVVLNEQEKTIFIDKQKAFTQIEEIFTKCIEGDLDYFALPREYARGFYEFVETKSTLPSTIKAVKGHVTGPISSALFLTDKEKRSIIYEKDIFEVLTKSIAMNARWQAEKLKEIHPTVIIFIDEPYFTSIGSSYVNINMQQAMEQLDEVIGAIHEAGALAGLHCCGNTDWPILLKRDIDIINFDAYNFMKEFLLYSFDVTDYIKRGKTIAWGIVPSSDAVNSVTVESLTEMLMPEVRAIKEKMGGAFPSSLVTSSCGVGSLDNITASKVIHTVRQLEENLRSSLDGR